MEIQGAGSQGGGLSPTASTYTIQSGDTLSTIAARNGTTVDALMQANPQVNDANLIFANDTLTLPGSSGNANESVTGGTGGDAQSLSLSQNGLDLIKSFEGLRLNSYQDSGGVWTIGYGHTAGVGPGQTITRDQAESLLRQDVQWAQDAVRDNVDVPITQNQFDALVSFTFNVGAGALGSSTLLSKLNAGDYAGAQQEFGRWVHAGGERLDGLVRRRGDEAALFGNQSPGTSEPTAPATTSTYTVKPGDTLSGIALATGVPLNDLIAQNPQISNVNLIYPGQELTLPGAATVASQPPVTGPDDAAPQYEPYTVYSTGDRPAFAVSDSSQLQAHHDYETRTRDGQTLEVRDIVLHRSGESQTAQAIPAPVSGEVIQAGPNGSAGNSVILRSESGQLVYIFHMSSIDVRVGQQVTYGQDLGNQGSTGNSTGPHIHIEAPDSVIDRWVDDLLDGSFDGIDSL